MIDRTQEDINQDAKIDALQRRLTTLESMVIDSKNKTVFLQQQLDAHAKRIDAFDPLKDLIDHVERIVSFFIRTKPK